MWRVFFYSLFFSSVLQATVNEPFRIEYWTGYQQDKVHWHVREGGEGGRLLYTEEMRGLEFWENGIGIETIVRDLFAAVEGSFSCLGRGSGTQSFGELGGDPEFSFSCDGYGGNAQGALGYAVNLTAQRTYKFLLIPLIGYGANFLHIDRSGEAALQPFRQTWYGFFVGGNVQIETGGGWTIQTGYSYHWLHLLLRTKMEIDAVSRSVTASGGGNLGHTGWLQVDRDLSPHWRLGLGGSIHYFCSHVMGMQYGGLLEKIKVRFVPVSGFVDLSWGF